MKVLAVTLISLSFFASVASQAQTIAVADNVLKENGYRALVELEAYEPVGCRRCGGSGYRGRIGLYEVMKMSPEIQTLEEIRKGDVIWIPAGVKHWHGATPNTAMTHIAIQEELNGKAVEWMEKVTEERYRK